MTNAIVNPTADRLKAHIASIEEILEEARSGRMFILVDDEDRENEGDLVIPAQFATPEAVNFMIRHARGLVCLALTKARVEKLGLPAMSADNGTRHQTAFTVSIEARHGVSTGISAHDRARTIAAAINPGGSADDVVTPGHVCPLAAQDGGCLVRAGHTEASVDIARLAGLYPAAVICEVLNEDGSMARLPDLVEFAALHHLKLGTIADLIAYRRRTERLVRLVTTGTIHNTKSGEWKVSVFQSLHDHIEHMALTKGNVAADEPVLVRMHAMDLLHDLTAGPGWDVLHSAMDAIAAAGRGAIVLLADRSATALSKRVAALDQNRPPEFELRHYGVGAQILRELGARDLILISNHPRHIVGIEGYGLNVVGQRGIELGAEH